MRALNLIPDLLEGAYEYLRRSPPFRDWRLPDGDHVVFRVLGARDRYGHFRGWHRRGNERGDVSSNGGVCGILRHREWGMYAFAVNRPDGLLVRVGWPSRLMADKSR